MLRDDLGIHVHGGALEGPELSGDVRNWRNSHWYRNGHEGDRPRPQEDVDVRAKVCLLLMAND